MRTTLLLLILSLQITIAGAQTYQNSWEALDARPIPTWFEDAKFGIFIHWGVYSVPAWRKLEPGLYASYAEWYYAKVMYNPDNGGVAFHRKNYGEDFEYRDFAPLFKAELFHPEAWANLFKKSGAKYVVLTSKHHDGYCLWPTKSPYKKNWNAMDIGPKRDLLGELSTAVKSAGLKMGLYYSIIEWESSWTHRTASGYYLPKKIVDRHKIPEDEYVDRHLMPQLKELVETYEPSLIFSDGGEWDGKEEYWKTKEFLSWLYSESPVKNEVVVNDRFAKNMPGNHGDYFSSEYKDVDESRLDHPWEESRGIGGSYGFNRAEGIEDYNSSEELIHELIDIVSRGGNLLLNVGPTADGRIPVIMQERLKDIGSWLKVNGEGIYETRKMAVDIQKRTREAVYFTRKTNALFCIFTQWKDTIQVSLLKGEQIKDVSMLGYDGKLKWKLGENDTLIIEIPKLTIDKIPCLYAWTLKIEFEETD
ncbi:alpha-L-fucosidase [Spongiimicrobium sp. 2-473A-2-J]|uniref:alpha-L-fucosidase n=1 Tax=Eudoraea algarum TaxID=3417568 RepID=UPI003D35F40D